MGHTPGPWIVDPRYKGDIKALDGNEIATAFNQYHVGERWEIKGPIPWTTDQQVANARLMAAAPDLLEALQDLERAATEASTRNEAARILSGSIHAARAAVARAIGEKS